MTSYFQDNIPDCGPVDSEHFDPSTEWQNYGDVNPERHGGIFVKWDTAAEVWRVVHTQSAMSLPKDMTTEDQMIQCMIIEPRDIWQDPKEADTDFTEDGAWVEQQLMHDYKPNLMPTLKDITGIMIPTLIAYRDYGRSTFFKSGDYEEIIESHGVDSQEAFDL